MTELAQAIWLEASYQCTHTYDLHKQQSQSKRDWLWSLGYDISYAIDMIFCDGYCYGEG